MNLLTNLSVAQCPIADDREDIIRFRHRYSVEINADGTGRSLAEMQGSFRGHFFLKTIGTVLTGDEVLTVDEVLRFRGLLTDVPTTDYINAVQIHFGLNGNRVVFIYEPGYLVFTAPSGLFFKTYEFRTSGHMLIKGAVTLEDYDEGTSNFITAYAKNICIVHSDDGPGCSALREGIDDPNANDVKTVIIPIQEILKEYCQNNGNGPLTGTDNINFINIASDDPYAEGISTNYKHSIAIRFGTSTEHDLHAFTGYAADFNEMCPPRCISHTYKIKHALWDLMIGIFH
jgi:hypothetical protein